MVTVTAAGGEDEGIAAVIVFLMAENSLEVNTTYEEHENDQKAM